MTKKTVIPFGRPLIGEEEQLAVTRVLNGPILVHGPVSEEFEGSFASFTGAPEAVSVSSCTAGMHLVYFALGYGKGDEVIVPAQTHVATAHAIELSGATPIFVDVELKTGNIDVSKIEHAITPNTRAIALVHYLGVPVDMTKIKKIATRHGLFLLEDCALALGAKVDQVHVGLHGDVGVFSFYPVKHITAAEGGMIVLRDKDLAKRLRLLRAFGVDRAHGERRSPGQYDCVALGFNYRMSEIHAAIGVEQLKKIRTFLSSRRENYSVLNEMLGRGKGYRLLPQPVDEHLDSSFYCMGVLLDSNMREKRTEIIETLAKNGIGASIYYPQPVPRMSYYRNKYGYEDSNFPNAATISDSMIALPVGPHADRTGMEVIGEELTSAIESFQ